MATSQSKKELEKKKQSKKKEKLQRKEIRKTNGSSKSFDDMIAYVDENGNITSTPPDPDKVVAKVDAENIVISTPKKEEVENPVLTGRVEYFNNDKGYGFIKDINSVEKYFFHINNAPDSITEGDRVCFETERGPKGMNAVRISIQK